MSNEKFNQAEIYASVNTLLGFYNYENAWINELKSNLNPLEGVHVCYIYTEEYNGSIEICFEDDSVLWFNYKLGFIEISSTSTNPDKKPLPTWLQSHNFI